MGSDSCTSSRAVVTGVGLCSARRASAMRFCGFSNEVRERYQFSLVGYVVMPEHIHLLISEPKTGHAFHRDAGAEAARLAVFAAGSRATAQSKPNATVARGARRSFAQFLAAALLRFQRVEREEEDRETELHAHESGETRVGGRAAVVDVEQLPVLSVWGEECVYAGSGTGVRVPSAGRGTAASKPAPSPAARVRHPKIQRRSFGWCGRVRHPPQTLEKKSCRCFSSSF